MLSFALKNLMVKRGRMALVALSIVISATVALISLNVAKQVNDGILSSYIYYDMIVGPSGSSTQLAMNTMFFTDKPLGTIPYSYVEELQNDPNVNAAVPFTMGDSFNSARIVGTTPALLEGKPLSQGQMFEDVYEAVVGSEVASRYGLKVGDLIVTSHGLAAAGAEHASSPLLITGILKTTHTNYDNTVFTSYLTVWAVHSHEEDEHDHAGHEEETEDASGSPDEAETNAPMSHGSGHASAGSADASDEDEEAEAHEGEVCAILVRSKSVAAYQKLSARWSGDARLLVINPAAVLREVLSQVDNTTRIVYVLCGVIMVMNMLVISVITLLNLLDSRREIALMRMIGISMKRIRQVYLIQNGILGLMSVALSLLLCHLSLGFMNGITSSMGIVLSPWRVYGAELLIALAVFSFSVLPTLISIYAMSRKDVIDT
ncbi:MAG: ABC transporter permease [Clostridia bacterium]|nr:ABC transporter permease [Clostridia bacterium]